MQLSGQPLPLFEYGRLLRLFIETGILNRHRGAPGQRHKEAAIIGREGAWLAIIHAEDAVDLLGDGKGHGKDGEDSFFLGDIISRGRREARIVNRHWLPGKEDVSGNAVARPVGRHELDHFLTVTTGGAHHEPPRFCIPDLHTGFIGVQNIDHDVDQRLENLIEAQMTIQVAISAI